jgi:hypothetical protein
VFLKINTFKLKTVEKGDSKWKLQVRVILPLLRKPQSIWKILNKPRSLTHATQEIKTKYNKISTGRANWTCPVALPDKSGICRQWPALLEIALFDSKLQSKLQLGTFQWLCNTENTYTQTSTTKEDWDKTNIKWNSIETRYLFYRSFDSLESYLCWGGNEYPL